MTAALQDADWEVAASLELETSVFAAESGAVRQLMKAQNLWLIDWVTRHGRAKPLDSYALTGSASAAC